MKQNKWMLRLSLIVLFVCSTSALQADEEVDHAELRKIKAAYEDAVNTNDPKKIAPYLSENVTGVMITGEPIEGLSGLESYWRKIQDLIGPGGVYRVKVNADKTEFFGDTSVSRGNTEDFVKLGSGKEFKFGALWTVVCRREGGSWKVLRMQATMDPVNNIFVSTKLQTTKFIYAAIGILIASALFLLLRALGKKRRPAK